MKVTNYPLYKGLQKPLVFKGFKGRYIYWAMGLIVLGVVLTALFGMLFNFFIGALMFVIVTVGGIFYTSQRQKRGLHDKTRHKTIYILKVNLRGNRNVKKENI